MSNGTEENMAGEPVVSTLNPPGDAATPLQEGVKIGTEAGISSIPDMSHGEEGGDLISTLDGGGETEKPAEVADDKSAEDKGSEDGKSKEGEEGKGEEDTRYDKLPRFQEIMTERDVNLERALKAEARNELLEDQGGDGGDTGEERDYTDIISLEDDQIREMIDENPKAFASNLAKQVLDEVRSVISNESKEDNYRGQVNSTHISHADKHEDFVPMLNDGRIADFIARNPGHNAMSAHLELTSENRVKAAVAEAVAAALSEAKKDQLVKRTPVPAGATSGGGVPFRSSSEGDQILKDSKKAGGKTMALVRKLRLDRAMKKATG